MTPAESGFLCNLRTRSRLVKNVVVHKMRKYRI